MRTEKKWEYKFECVKRLMSVMDSISEEFLDNSEIIEICATMLRNPIVFDNNIKDVKTKLDFHIENMKKETEDHLIGMSNIVLYIHKRGLHKKWKSVTDFKNTLRALNILLPIEKKLNNSKMFKHNWKFNYNNIELCLEWDNKLKSIGITELVCNNTKLKIDVTKIKNDWYNTNKEYL